ncbi:hypothetical protein ACHAXR_003938 [Thalassiosira sp. AJA248-18]
MLVSVPYWEWQELGHDQGRQSKKENNLRCILGNIDIEGK